MTRRTRRRRLILRVYAFTAALSIAIMVALLVLPRYTRSARYLEPQAALLQFLVDRWSTKNTMEFDQALARITPRLRGGLTLFDANGTMMRNGPFGKLSARALPAYGSAPAPTGNGANCLMAKPSARSMR